MTDEEEIQRPSDRIVSVNYTGHYAGIAGIVQSGSSIVYDGVTNEVKHIIMPLAQDALEASQGDNEALPLQQQQEETIEAPKPVSYGG